MGEVAADVRLRYNRTSVHGPMEQLNLTDNDSDYLWYVLSDLSGLPPSVSATDIKVKSVSGTIAYPYILSGGRVVNQLLTARADAEIAILACAMGLSNGGVGPHSIKGISSVKVSGVSVTNRSWTHRWIMRGEDLEVYTAAGKNRVQWSPLTGPQGARAHTWFGAEIKSPAIPHAETKSGLGPQYAVALDLS